MAYTRNREYAEGKSRMHGKYLLRTSLDEQNETDIWTFYNVIRTVEETFKTLKSDLDIRPVFHKGDKGTKAHLNDDVVLLSDSPVIVTRELKHTSTLLFWPIGLYPLPNIVSNQKGYMFAGESYYAS